MTAATLAKARLASAPGVDSIFHAWLAHGAPPPRRRLVGQEVTSERLAGGDARRNLVGANGRRVVRRPHSHERSLATCAPLHRHNPLPMLRSGRNETIPGRTARARPTRPSGLSGEEDMQLGAREPAVKPNPSVDASGTSAASSPTGGAGTRPRRAKRPAAGNPGPSTSRQAGPLPQFRVVLRGALVR